MSNAKESGSGGRNFNPSGNAPHERDSESPRPLRREGGRPEGEKRAYAKKKICRYCSNPNIKLDYKDARALRQFLSERGKIAPRRTSGMCAKHQRGLAVAMKRARALGLIPFTSYAYEG